MDTLRDMWESLKEQVLDVWYNVSSRLPAGSEIPIISGVAALLALLAIVNTIGTTKTASNLESDAVRYKAIQEQLNATLGDSVDIGFSEDDQTIVGRSNLVLQYKDLANLPSDGNIKSMKKSLDLGDDETEEENENYTTAKADSIREFAGDYGGALVVPTSIGTNDLQLAAYSANNQMRASSSDNGAVSNVLYEKISRTIQSSEYGVGATRNNLIFLSASSINGLDNIREGATLYTLFGDANTSGSKETNKYVCTGIETGKMDAVSTDDDDATSSDNTENSNESTENGTSEAADNEATTSEDDVLETSASVPVLKTDTGVTAVAEEDTTDDAGAYNSDGSVNEEWVEQNSSNSDSDDSSDESDSSDDDSDGTSSSAYVDDGISTKSKTSTTAYKYNILDASGNLLTDNKTADLIVYEYDKDTGNVTITYWELS